MLGTFNHYGEVKKINLKYSGYIFKVSQVEWEYVDGNILTKAGLTSQSQTAFEQLKPDVEVKSNIADLRNEEDNILKKALGV